ncbi:MAG: hypothetical protein EB003_12280 [Flavobacteriia bacterium]|jgi:hypothetical protein|nr:hypothetical protein [Flavobacteriia bacterium]
MKTNYSKQQIENFAAALVAKGWSKSVENGIESYGSPMTATCEWVNITIYGRCVRTVTSWDVRNTKLGLVNASLAVKNLTV